MPMGASVIATGAAAAAAAGAVARAAGGSVRAWSRSACSVGAGSIGSSGEGRRSPTRMTAEAAVAGPGTNHYAQAMEGLMMDYPLLVRHIAERAATVFGGREIVSRGQETVERTTYAQVVERARRLASALSELGIRPGDRVATFGWNSARHLELYLAVPSMGAVLHTLNIRLFEEDLRYIVDHAEDKVIFLDASVAKTMPSFEGVGHEVLMPDAPGEREGALNYEELVAGGDPS